LFLVATAVVIFMLTVATDRALGHTPPEFPTTDEVCSVFTEIPDCHVWYPQWVEQRLVEIAEDAHRQPVRRSASTWTGTAGVEQWRGLVTAHFGSNDANTALCLMHYESGGNPDAKNPRSSARGLMQILTSLWGPHFGLPAEAFYNPETNIRYAKKVYDLQGWGAWSPYNRGLCR